MKFTTKTYAPALGLLAVFAIPVLVSAQTDRKSDQPGARRGQLGRKSGGMLKALDKDKDGKISQAEAPERMKDRFAQLDQNGDGFVDGDEIAKVMANRTGQSRPNSKGFGAPSDSPRGGTARLDLARLFKEMDKNKDGNLDQDEQAAVIKRLEELQNRMRQGMRKRGEQDGKGSNDRFDRGNTDPIKPKRPGMED